MFAVKSIPRDKIKADIHLLEQELDILKGTDHPNIINFYEIYKDRQNFHIVTDFCEGGELFEYIIDRGSLPELEAATITTKIVSAIHHLHLRNICHRDLKPENILFDGKNKKMEIKVIDFGLSKYFKDNGTMTTKLGTPYYISPEVLEGKYDKSCDVWSIGVITYIMLVGYPPFNAPTETLLFRKILCCDYEFRKNDWKDISVEAMDFIKKCL
jgi:calcium-dependent protein kinase